MDGSSIGCFTSSKQYNFDQDRLLLQKVLLRKYWSSPTSGSPGTLPIKVYSLKHSRAEISRDYRVVLPGEWWQSVCINYYAYIAYSSVTLVLHSIGNLLFFFFLRCKDDLFYIMQKEAVCEIKQSYGYLLYCITRSYKLMSLHPTIFRRSHLTICHICKYKLMQNILGHFEFASYCSETLNNRLHEKFKFIPNCWDIPAVMAYTLHVSSSFCSKNRLTQAY